MEQIVILTYQSPAVRVIEINSEFNFCISGNHQGTTEEDWDDLP